MHTCKNSLTIVIKYFLLPFHLLIEMMYIHGRNFENTHTAGPGRKRKRGIIDTFHSPEIRTTCDILFFNFVSSAYAYLHIWNKNYGSGCVPPLSTQIMFGYISCYLTFFEKMSFLISSLRSVSSAHVTKFASSQQSCATCRCSSTRPRVFFNLCPQVRPWGLNRIDWILSTYLKLIFQYRQLLYIIPLWQVFLFSLYEGADWRVNCVYVCVHTEVSSQKGFARKGKDVIFGSSLSSLVQVDWLLRPGGRVEPPSQTPRFAKVAPRGDHLFHEGITKRISVVFLWEGISLACLKQLWSL